MYRHTLLVAITALFLTAGIAAGYAWRQHELQAAKADRYGDQAEIEGLFKDGLAATLTDFDRAELLTQNALRRQGTNPEAAPRIWAAFYGFLQGQQSNPEERLAKVLAYRESLDRAISEAATRSAVDVLWQTRKEVVAAADRYRGTVLQDVRSDVEASEKRLTSVKTAVEALKLLAELHDRNEARFRVLEGATGKQRTTARTIAGDVGLTRLENTALAKVETSLDDLESRLRTIADQPASLGEEAEKKGACTGLIADLEQLSDGLDRALSPESIFTDREVAVSSTKAAARLAGLQERAVNLRQVRYNLWALREIHAAESAFNWGPYLGRVEVGVLHPTVSALYSMTYDNRIRKIEEPARTTAVQTILRQEKIPMAAF